MLLQPIENVEIAGDHHRDQHDSRQKAQHSHRGDRDQDPADETIFGILNFTFTHAARDRIARTCKSSWDETQHFSDLFVRRVEPEQPIDDRVRLRGKILPLKSR